MFSSWKIIFTIELLISNGIAVEMIDNAGVNNSDSHISCNKERLLQLQPDNLDFPIVRKCCSDTENLYIVNSTIQNYGCNRAFYPIVVNFSIVDLYEDCLLFRNRSAGEIQLENADRLPGYEYFPCFYYGDFFGSHIIQNGSLLVTNTYASFNYRIHNDFCIDADVHTGMYMICHDAEESVILAKSSAELIQKQGSFTESFLTILSIPCLIGIIVLYVAIKEFRNLHGVCIISLCSFTIVEYVLRSILSEVDHEKTESLAYTIQYFDLVHHFWMLVLFINTMLFVWIYLPYNLLEWKYFGNFCYAAFFICCLAIPSMIFNQLQDNDIQNFLDFFTTPKTTVTLLCVMILLIIFMGTNRLASIVKQQILQKYYSSNPSDNDSDIVRHHLCFEEIQSRLTCLTSLAGVMVITRAFFIPGHRHLIVMRQILISLQGVFFILIFLGLRYKEVKRFLVCRFLK